MFNENNSMKSKLKEGQEGISEFGTTSYVQFDTFLVHTLVCLTVMLNCLDAFISKDCIKLLTPPGATYLAPSLGKLL